MPKLASHILFTILMMPAALHAGDPDSAQIVTHKKDLGHCLGPVVITHVDGQLRQLPPLGFDLDPGRHTLDGMSAPSGGLCMSARSSRSSPPPITPLEADFEAGKVYYVGFDHSAHDPADWRLRIWKILDAEGEVLMDATGEAADPNG